MSIMTDSVTYADLEKKYNQFAAPTVYVTVEGTELRDKYQVRFSAVTVELTSDFSASRCTFTVEQAYDYENSAFQADIFKTLQIGAKVEVKLGYVETVSCFSGLITEVSYELSAEEAPFIQVECADAKVLLMKMQRLEILSETTVDKAVTAMLGEAPVSAYLDGKEVEDPGVGEEALSAAMESNYDFIVNMARYSGFEFFIVCGKAYFRKKPTSGTAIMTLSPGMGIVSYRCTLSGISLVETVQVQAIDIEKNTMVTGEAKTGGTFGEGSTPAQMITGSKRICFDARSTTADMAKKRAQVILDQFQENFVRVEVECVGLPQIVPGRTITVSGMMQKAPTTLYITNVSHQLDETGFYTRFEGRANSL